MSPSPVSRRPASGRAAAGVAPRAVSVLPGAGGAAARRRNATVVRSTRSAAEAAEKEEVLNPLRSGDGTTVRRRTRRPDPRHPRRSPARDRLQGHHAPARPPAGLRRPSRRSPIRGVTPESTPSSASKLEASSSVPPWPTRSASASFRSARRASSRRHDGPAVRPRIRHRHDRDPRRRRLARRACPRARRCARHRRHGSRGGLLLQRLGATSPVARSCSNCRSSTGEPSSAMLVSRR